MNCNGEAERPAVVVWGRDGLGSAETRWEQQGPPRGRWRWRAHRPVWGLRDLGSAPGSGDPLEERGHSTLVFLPRESRGLQRVGHDWASDPMHRSSRNRRGLYEQYYYVRSNKTWHDRLWKETELVKILLSFLP